MRTFTRPLLSGNNIESKSIFALVHIKHILLSVITIVSLFGSFKAYAQGPTFSYSTPNVYVYGNTVNISPSVSSSSGTITWAIDALPAGLTFDTATGTISGTPSAISAATDYNVTATDGTGTSSPFTVNIEVDPAPLTITANDQSKTYGTTFSFAGTEFTTSGLVNSDAVSSVTLTSAGAAATATVAGSPYTIVPSAAAGSGLSNYTITYTNGSMTINTAALTITAKPQSKTYGATFSFAGTEFTASGLVNSDAVSSVTLTSAGSPATATVAGSSYSIIPSAAIGSGLSNYTITYVNGSMTVNTAALTITAKPQSKTYGTTFSFTGTEFTASGLVNSDVVSSVTLTSAGSAATGTVVGSPYSIVPSAATGTGLSNYTITYVNGAMTVNTATLTITAKPQSKTYGTTFSFAGTEFTTSGLVNSDAVSSVTLTSAGSPATATVAGSPYSIVPSAAIGSGLSNYTITYVNGSMTVNTAPLTITANSQSKAYNTTFTFAGTEFTTSGLVNSDAVSSVTLTSAGSPASATVAGSPYPIVPSAAVGTGLSNYAITYVNGSMTVTSQTLTITAVNQTKTYGTTFTFAGTEFTVSGLTGSDNVSSVTLTSTGSASTASVAGSPYSIVPSAAVGTGLSNYAIVYVNGSMTVTAKALTISGMTANNKTYDATTTATFTGGTLVGVVAGDVVTFTPSGTFATKNVGTGIAVTSTTTLGGAQAGNYTLTQPTGLTANITTLAITVNTTGLTTNPASGKTYDGTTTAPLKGSATGLTGVLAADAGNVTLVGTPTGTFANANVGTWTITLTGYSIGGSAAGNYTLTSPVTITGKITKATLTLTPTPLSKVYGTTEPSSQSGQTTFTAAGLQNGETIGTVTINYGLQAQNIREQVGTYSTNANYSTTATNPVGGTFNISNYSVSSPTGTFTVIPAPFYWIGATSTNWRTTTNWYSAGLQQDYNYPGKTNSADVVYVGVSGGPTGTPSALTSPTLVLDSSLTVASFTFGNSGSSTINFNPSAGITVATSGGFTLNSGTLTVNMVTNNPTITIGGNYTSSSSGNIFNKGGSNPMTITGTTTNVGTFNQSGTGLVTMTGATTNIGTINQTSTGSMTFTGDFTNSGSSSVFKQTGSGTATFSGALTNQGTFTQGSGIVTVVGTLTNSGTLTLGSNNFNVTTGDFINSGTFTAGTGTVYFTNLLGTQKLFGGSGTGTVFNNVTISGSTGPTKIQTGAVGISTSGVLTLTGSNTTFANVGGSLTIYSSATGSGTVAAIPTGCSITGTVTVQRYTSAVRGYRLMSSPVYAANDGTNNYYGLSYLETNCYLTGDGGGWDKAGNPTLYLYRENLVPQYSTFFNSNFIGVANITNSAAILMDDSTYPSIDIPVGNGYLFFYRGSRNQMTLAAATTPGAAATTDTLNAVGTLIQGNVTVHDWYTKSSGNLGYTPSSGAGVTGFNLVGNPYASSIDWDQYGSNITVSNVAAFSYQLVLSGQGAGNYNVYTANTNIGGNKQGTLGRPNSNIIVSGQGFFVQATSAGALLTFKEAAKTNTQVTGTSLYMSGKHLALSNSDQYLRLQLSMDSINTDGTLIRFNSEAQPTYNPMEDAIYKVGFGKVSLSSLSSDNVPLAIDQLPLGQGDTIGLKIATSVPGNYTLTLADLQGIPQIFDVWLMDALTKDSLNLRSTNSYNFAVTADTNSYGSHRFSVAIRENPALAYKLLNFTGEKISKRSVQLTWRTQNEQNSTNFTVERSNDHGKTYDIIGSLTGTGAGIYSLVDPEPMKGDNQYRLKSEDYNNTITYSNIINEQFQDNGNDKSSHLSLYPNPAVNTIYLTIIPKSQGNTTYGIRISNSAGLVVKNTTISDVSWQNNVSDLLTGTYLIEVIDNKDNSIIGQTKFIKL